MTDKQRELMDITDSLTTMLRLKGSLEDSTSRWLRLRMPVGFLGFRGGEVEIPDSFRPFLSEAVDRAIGALTKQISNYNNQNQ